MSSPLPVKVLKLIYLFLGPQTESDIREIIVCICYGVQIEVDTCNVSYITHLTI